MISTLRMQGGLPESQLQKVVAAVTKSFREDFIPSVMPVYKKYFTVEDLKAINRFYETPVGKKMKKFSGGMLQRVGIAQALLNDPKILILDEPTAGLDPKGRDEILDQIALLQKKTGITVILVSHSMDDVAKYVDRIIVMNKGRVMYDDEPREVFRHYMELEKIGLAAPQVTYIMKDLQNQGIMVSDDVTTIDEAKEEIKNYFVRLAHEKSHDI